MKGCYNINPPSPKYSTTWDPQPVLLYLENKFPLQTLTLKELTQKLAILVALTTAHRVQILSIITVDNIAQGQNRLEVKIPARIKTSGPRKKQPVLIFPYFTDNPQLCVASTLEFYLSKTAAFRNQTTDPLFYTYVQPHHPATSQTISRWIKDVLKRKWNQHKPLYQSLCSPCSYLHSVPVRGKYRFNSLYWWMVGKIFRL